MYRTSRILSAFSAGLMALAVLGGSAVAQETAPDAAAAAEPARDPDAVVARIGEDTVTEREVSIAADAFASELANIPDAQRRSALVDAVVNMKLLARAAEEEGLGKGPDFDAQVAFLKLQALRNTYVEQSILKAVTDEELATAYQDLVVSQFKPEEQVHARHILVETREEAEKIIGELKGGASFEELAKQSKDPSGQNGGDLGFFGKGQMVPEFETAAFALEPGKTTEEPVQTQFGWHVIRSEGKRMSEPPKLDDVKEQLRAYLVRQKFQATLEALRDKYKVEIVDPTAAPPVEAPAGDAPPAEAPAEQPQQ
jgi:peptidyl-prolyl cis-trans isomerase C